MSSQVLDPKPLSDITLITRMRRRLPVSLERMYENALDWEHLPWLHSSSFSSIDCLESGSWGWRATANLASPDPTQLAGSGVWYKALGSALLKQPVELARYIPALFQQIAATKNGAEVTLELLLDRDLKSWTTRTLAGPSAGSEITAQVIEHGERDIEVIVDFHVPRVPRALHQPIASYYLALYAQLYNEDEQMMATRQHALDSARSSNGNTDEATLNLGSTLALKDRLPITVEFGGRQWRIIELDNDLFAHSLVCPHMLGPLGEQEVTSAGEIECPWHGYRFDVKSGKNVSGQRCKLYPAPSLQIDGSGNAILTPRS